MVELKFLVNSKIMNLFFKYVIGVLFFLITITGFAQDLVILHTNDTHSQIEPFTTGRNKGFGGFQRRAEFIKKVKAQHDNVLIVDAGDFNQGTPYFTIFKGDVEVKLYNAMGYEAVCLGNHEFDNGMDELARRISMQNFPTLCANYDFKKTPLKRVVKPYTIIEKGGKKIGIIGVLLDLDGYVSEKSRKGATYSNPIPVVNKLAKMLRTKKRCDLVVVLSHLGFDGGTAENPSDTELAKLTENVDLIIGGHSHTFLEKPVPFKNRSGNEVLVTQMGASGVYVGKIAVNF